jgi:DNA mismatch repair protein MutS2
MPGVIERILDDKVAEVAVGAIRAKFLLSSLSKIMPTEEKTSQISFKRSVNSLPFSIDVRGMDAIDALSAIDQYLDQAAVAGYDSVMIIHGKGEGILRKETAAFLKTHPHVKNHRIGGYNEGGSGATIVEIQ